MAPPLIAPQLPVIFEVVLRGQWTDLNEEQVRLFIMGKLSTINLNATTEIKTRRMTVEELAEARKQMDALAVGLKH